VGAQRFRVQFTAVLVGVLIDICLERFSTPYELKTESDDISSSEALKCQISLASGFGREGKGFFSQMKYGQLGKFDARKVFLIDGLLLIYSGCLVNFF